MSASPRPSSARRLLEQRPRLLDRPAAVDQGQPVVGLEDVDVDRAQAVHRQRQRDPVHPGRDRVRAGLGPAPGVVGRVVGRRGHGYDPRRGGGTRPEGTPTRVVNSRVKWAWSNQPCRAASSASDPSYPSSSAVTTSCIR